MYRLVYIGIFTVIATAATQAFAKDCVIRVSASGGGDVRTVSEAIDKVPVNNASRCVIRIAPGTYNEQVRVPANKPYISFVGEDASKTVLTFSISNKDVGSTSAAFATYIAGHDFQA